MENLLLLLPNRPQSLWVRYGVTSVIVLFCFVVRIGLEDRAGTYGFFLLFPAIFLSSVLFDRGSGFLATGLSIALMIWMLDPQLRPGMVAQHAVALSLFAVIAAGIVVISEALRRALERAMAAERANALLLQEMGHRVRNNLTILSSLLTLQAKGYADPVVREAFKTAEARVRAVAAAHQHLETTQSLVNLQEYLEALGAHLGETLRGVRPIAVRIDAEPLLLPGEKAAQFGLIVNELITNAFKYAFEDAAPGLIAVTLTREKDCARLVVGDNGRGCHSNTPEGLGMKITRLLTAQMNGSVARTGTAGGGCTVTVLVPLRD